MRKYVEEMLLGDFALTGGEIVLAERAIAGFDDERVNQLSTQDDGVVRQFDAAGPTSGRDGALFEGMLDGAPD